MNSPVQSIDRIFDIVETLAQWRQGMTLSDLAAATGLHVSTAHRLVQSLAHRGYAIKDRSGNYRLTLRLYEVGSQVSGVLNLLTVARPMLDRLANTSQEAVHLVERDGSDVLYLYKAEPRQQFVRMSSCVGLRNPMYCTGVGKSILALLPEDQLREVWESTQVCAFTEKTITDLDALQADLARIRQRGYAIDDEEHETGVRCIAVAVRNSFHAPVAAISVSAPASRLDEKAMAEIYPQLKAISGELSRLLGEREE